MKHRNYRKLWFGLSLLGAFVLWTILVCTVDVRAIGPNGSSVGFAAINGLVHRALGVNMTLYKITDLLGLIPFGFVLAFAAVGFVQLLRRKSHFKVDRSILALGGFYIVVLALYFLFEKAVVNCRPVLIDGILESSYPSSTTVLSLCVMPSAIIQLRHRIHSALAGKAVFAVLTAFTVFMVVGRLFSGVHWLSDIIGGVLLSAGLTALYSFAAEQQKTSR